MTSTFVNFSTTKAVYSAIKDMLAQHGYHRETVHLDGSISLNLEGIGLVEEPEPKQMVVSDVLGSTPYLVNHDIPWRYDAAPHGVKVFLLTCGGIAVGGTWRDNGSFIGWNPLFKRDKEAERRLGIR